MVTRRMVIIIALKTGSVHSTLDRDLTQSSQFLSTYLKETLHNKVNKNQHSSDRRRFFYGVNSDRLEMISL